MNPINTTDPQWFKDHAADYGATWVDVVPPMEAPPKTVGALIKPDGSILHWIKQI